MLLISAQNLYARPSGAQKFVSSYARHLDRTVLTRRDPLAQYAVDGKPVDAKGFIRDLQPRFAHVHSLLDARCYGGMIDSLKQSAHVIYFCHEIPGLDDEEAFHELLEKADAVVCFTRHQREQLPRHREKAVVIYHGTEESKPAEKEEKILYAGRITPEKGVLDLVDAHRNGTRGELVLIGHAEPAFRDEIESRLQGTPHSILDWVHDDVELKRHLARAAVVVLPSHHDLFNITGIEALSVGTQLITSDIPSFTEVYLDHGLALGYPRGDSHRLGAAIDIALMHMDHPVLPARYTRNTFQANLEALHRKFL